MTKKQANKIIELLESIQGTLSNIQHNTQKTKELLEDQSEWEEVGLAGTIPNDSTTYIEDPFDILMD